MSGSSSSSRSGSASRQRARPDQLALAAAEQLHRLLPLRFVQPELAQQPLGAVVQAWPAQRLELLEQALVLGQHPLERAHVGGHRRVAHARLGGGDARFERGQVRAGGQQLVQHRAAGLAGVLLRQVGHARAAPQRDRAGVGPLEPGQRAQQGRFADAVRPDQADLLVILDRPTESALKIVRPPWTRVRLLMSAMIIASQFLSVVNTKKS